LENIIWSMDLLQRVSDAELVRRAQGRQGSSGAEAVGEIYDRYHERIFRYLWARVSEKQLAEDLTAEVFMRMITHLHQYRTPATLAPEAPFQTWLYRIAHNLLVDHYRNKSRRQEQSLEQVEHLAEEHGDVAKIVEQRLRFEQVQTALQQISPEHQDVLILRFMIGLSLQEVAQVLGKTLAVVKITQHRGLEKLRVALGIGGSEDQDGRD
jgi:RNA polymerase sigma-70 factor (ECF subfamily)